MVKSNSGSSNFGFGSSIKKSSSDVLIEHNAFTNADFEPEDKKNCTIIEEEYGIEMIQPLATEPNDFDESAVDLMEKGAAM